MVLQRMVTRKFAKYQGDIRYKQYVNTGNNTREGMFFLEGKIANSAVSGGYAKNPDNQYVIYWRDRSNVLRELGFRD